MELHIQILLLFLLRNSLVLQLISVIQIHGWSDYFLLPPAIILSELCCSFHDSPFSFFLCITNDSIADKVSGLVNIATTKYAQIDIISINDLSIVLYWVSFGQISRYFSDPQYYFQVNDHYVRNKLKVVLFPFLHRVSYTLLRGLKYSSFILSFSALS